MKTNNQIWKIALIIFLVLNSIPLWAQTILYQDFESGWGSWWADNGIWEVGMPTVGPTTTFSSPNCAGTILDGNYPSLTNSRLVSPLIRLPSISADERILLRFWQWFRINEDNYYGYDKAYIEISVAGGPWQSLLGPISGLNPVWSQVIVDLTAYADSNIRVGFHLNAGTYVEDNGWYIDNIAITFGPTIFNNPENFDNGIGDWWSDNGLWEVGTPLVGPASAHSPPYCAGTVLNGNYTSQSNTRFISPLFRLNPLPDRIPELYFWQWFRLYQSGYYGYDYGYVQVSVNFGPWQTIAGPFSGNNVIWSQSYVDLSAFTDSTIRIAFYLTSGTLMDDNGWYIDDVRITGLITDVDNSSWESKVLKSFALDQNYPNPFNRSTTIHFELPKESHVKLIVYNMLGQKVMNVVDEEKPAGRYDVRLDSSSLPSGVYFYRLFAGEFTSTKKFILLK